MLSSFFKKENKAYSNYSYEYSFITYGELIDQNKLPPSFNKNDYGHADAFCYFTHANEKYFAIGDRIGRLVIFNYNSGVELKCVLMKSRAYGLLRVKKYITFLKETIDDLQTKLVEMVRDRLSKDVVIVKEQGGNDENKPIIKADLIIDNYDTESTPGLDEGSLVNPDCVEEVELRKKLEDIKQIHLELVDKIKNYKGDEIQIVLEFAENKINEIDNKFGINGDSAMISYGGIGGIEYLNGLLFVSFKKEIYKISVEELIEMKEMEIVVSEGLINGHDGMIKKLHVMENFIISIGNDKKICIWNSTNDAPVLIINREDEDYYGASYLSSNNMLFVSGSNEVLAFELDPLNIQYSHYLKTLQVNNKSPHDDSINLIGNISSNKLLTASCDGIIAVWDLDDLSNTQILALQIQSSEQKKSLRQISSLITIQRENWISHFFIYGSWIVQLENKNGVLNDVSPKRLIDSIGIPYGKYNVDLTHLLLIGKTTLIAVTAESATLYISEIVKEKKRDVLKSIESRRVNGKIETVRLLDNEESSFIITLQNGTIIMLKDSTKEMKRRQEMFLKEMQSF
ncbi:WD domain containing protein [Entamoeba marina]